MDLYEKIRQLETELYDAKPAPFTKKATVDTEKCLSILNEIKRAIPDDVYDLNRLADEKKKLLMLAEENLSRVNKQAERLVAEAESRAAVIIDESNTVREAEYEAEKIKRMALRELEVAELKIRERLAGILIGAEEYLAETLRDIRSTQAELGVQIGKDPGAGGRK